MSFVRMIIIDWTNGLRTKGVFYVSWGHRDNEKQELWTGHSRGSKFKCRPNYNNPPTCPEWLLFANQMWTFISELQICIHTSYPSINFNIFKRIYFPVIDIALDFISPSTDKIEGTVAVLLCQMRHFDCNN